MPSIHHSRLQEGVHSDLNETFFVGEYVPPGDSPVSDCNRFFTPQGVCGCAPAGSNGI